MTLMKSDIWRLFRIEESVFAISKGIRPKENLRYPFKGPELGTIILPLNIDSMGYLMSSGPDTYTFFRIYGEGDSDPQEHGTWGFGEQQILPPYLESFRIDGWRIKQYCESPCGMVYYGLLPNGDLYAIDRE